MLTVDQFDKALETGKYAWPGGYEISALASDGETICFNCCETNATEIRAALTARNDPDWQIEAFHILWEGPAVQCAHCNRDVETAYGETE